MKENQLSHPTASKPAWIRVALAASLILALTMSKAPVALAQKDNVNWGIGLRFGSPSAFNVKRYLGNHAWDFNVGSGFYGLYDNPEGRYRTIGFSVMINHHWRKPIQNAPGLTWYYGLGGLVSARSYVREKKGFADENVNRVSIGPTGALGLEYIIPKSPISIFAEINPYVELLPTPFYIGLLGGIGGRIVF